MYKYTKAREYLIQDQRIPNVLADIIHSYTNDPHEERIQNNDFEKRRNFNYHLSGIINQPVRVEPPRDRQSTIDDANRRIRNFKRSREDDEHELELMDRENNSQPEFIRLRNKIHKHRDDGLLEDIRNTTVGKYDRENVAHMRYKIQKRYETQGSSEAGNGLVSRRRMFVCARS